MTQPLMPEHRYLVIWTYIANHGTMIVDATSPAEAAEKVRRGFSDDFRKRGTMYIVESRLVSIFSPGSI